MPEKRIGFVDYGLENYHANVYLKILRNELKDRGFTVAGCTALQQEAGRQWAEKNGVAFFSSVAEMNPHVDFFVVLAPNNPETHLALCGEVFPFGKTTFVDKTFAPDHATAKRIFRLADKHGIAVETSSALRYTAVQEYVRKVGQRNVRHIAAWGAGREFDIYAIHPVEMVISCLGPDAKSMMRRGTGKESQLLINFSGDRTAVVNVYTQTNTPFMAAVTTGDETQMVTVDNGRLFIEAASAFLRLFESGKAGVDRNESLMVRRILDKAGDPAALKRFVRL